MTAKNMPHHNVLTFDIKFLSEVENRRNNDDYSTLFKYSLKKHSKLDLDNTKTIMSKNE